MATCSHCGAPNAEGSAFCTDCGQPLLSEQDDSVSPVSFVPSASPEPSRPAPSGRGKKLLIGAIAALVLAGAVLGTLFFTGVLGKKGLAGTWVSQTSTATSGLTLAVDRNGAGYAVRRHVSSVYNSTLDATVDYYLDHYMPLTWSDEVITVDGDTCTYQLEGDTLTVYDGGEAFVFLRSDEESIPSRSRPKPGRYLLVDMTDKGVSLKGTSIFSEDTILDLRKGGIGIITEGANPSRGLTWDDYFVSLPNGSYFYQVSGSTLTLKNDVWELTFIRTD